MPRNEEQRMRIVCVKLLGAIKIIVRNATHIQAPHRKNTNWRFYMITQQKMHDIIEIDKISSTKKMLPRVVFPSPPDWLRQHPPSTVILTPETRYHRYVSPKARHRDRWIESAQQYLPYRGWSASCDHPASILHEGKSPINRRPRVIMPSKSRVETKFPCWVKCCSEAPRISLNIMIRVAKAFDHFQKTRTYSMEIFKVSRIIKYSPLFYFMRTNTVKV